MYKPTQIIKVLTKWESECAIWTLAHIIFRSDHCSIEKFDLTKKHRIIFCLNKS